MSETFDALDAARKLKDAGMERPHTEAVAAVVRDSRDGLATKAGMDALRRELATHRWVLSLIASMCMATLAGVVVIALQL